MQSFVDVLFNDKQVDRFLKKIFKIDTIYQNYLIKEKKLVDAKLFETKAYLNNPPKNVSLRTMKQGDTWGSEFGYGWFYLNIDGIDIDENTYLYSRSDAIESLVFVNDQPYGMFDTNDFVKDAIFKRHEYVQLHKDVKNITVHAYASHTFYGTMPYEKKQTFSLTTHKPVRDYEGFYLVKFNEPVKTLIHQIAYLRSFYQVIKKQQQRSFLELCMELYQLIDFMPTGDLNFDNITKANKLISNYLLVTQKESLNDANIYIIGHSHLDTAWLWNFDETKKKFIETVSTAVKLLKKYPNYKFMMSSILHFEWLRVDYPELFETVLALEKEGRFEINGATYVEPDCNLTGSESLVRHFLRGQRWMKKYTNHYADAFFLPDTFGYSSAIPQIMKKAHAPYFLTTKLRWNDTNKFPLDTFYWQGLDGTRVLTHFNYIQVNPDPQSLMNQYKTIEHQITTDDILVSYGYGDGGGGASEEMVKDALLSEQVMTSPKVTHTTVSQAMKNMSKKTYPVYTNELYLELHRATYTNNLPIKYYNRKAENALHNLDFIASIYDPSKKSDIDQKYDILMKNQFHDILPATAIKEANDIAILENKAIVEDVDHTIHELIQSKVTLNDEVTLMNMNGTKIDGYQLIDGHIHFSDLDYQHIMIYNKPKTIVELQLDSYEIKSFKTTTHKDIDPKQFNIQQDKDRIQVIENNAYRITFDDNMFITSFFDKQNQREVVAHKFNRLSMAKHVPHLWDTWDMDKDYSINLKDVDQLKSVKLISSGPLACVIEVSYQLTKNSDITQKMVFYQNTARVDFFTKIDWHDEYYILKTFFDTNFVTSNYRSEIQFGHETRNTHNNAQTDQAQFEVMNHKWTNMSESNYGLTLMNSSSYGISVKYGEIGLTLLTSGTRPDPTASKGMNYLNYSVKLNANGFNAKDVIHPSYDFNNPPYVFKGRLENQVIASVDNPNVIIETIKLAEEEGIILRLYEASSNHVVTNLKLFDTFEIHETDLLEIPEAHLATSNKVSLTFKPFEIKTILLKKA